MVETNKQHHISDEDRREFLKVLGVSSAVAVGGATIDEVREATAADPTEELASIGQAIKADLAKSLDAEVIVSQQAAIAEAATAVPTAVEKGLPANGPRSEFAAVAEAAWPVYDHLVETSFFESTTQHLPAFSPSYLESSVEAFVGSEALTAPLKDLGFTGGEGVDLLATVVANAEDLSTHHWVATDEIPREQVGFGDFIPPMTQATAGGVLLWLEDLDQHLWQDKVLLTDDILADTAWHGQLMAAGLQLMTEGAKVVAEESGELSDGELGALLSTGFAVQAISQALLPQDVYWITEEMRAPRP
jgi:hypothetical protein